MSLLNWFFNKKEENKPASVLGVSPQHRLGRYTDAYKTDEQLAHWETARNAFEQKHFYQSCLALLSYIRDEQADNVHWEVSEQRVDFEIAQGSERVKGYFDEQQIVAEVGVAKGADSLNIGLMRRLIDHSTKLVYGSYALAPDQKIVVKFSSQALDGSPYKIFHGLKEIATQADKQDDLLLHDFQELQIIDESLRLHHDEQTKLIKHTYLTTLIREVFAVIEQADLEQQPKTVSYLLLDVIYKIAYLVNPEGVVMDLLEEAQYQYFLNDNKRIQLKNAGLQKALQTIVEKPADVVKQEFYATVASFGITQPVGQDTFIQYFDSEMPQIDLYFRQNELVYAVSACSNVVGFCLNNFTLPLPSKMLLELFYKIFENQYFISLGEKAIYKTENNTVAQKPLQQALEDIILKNKLKFPYFKPSVTMLDFSNPATFAKTYLLMVRNLDYNRN
jgi:hypothetical protein